jgi:hypothetical protein
LWHLQCREEKVRNGRTSTIIFIRYREGNGREVSAYIDYRERLKTDNMELVFSGERDLIPKPSDLSYYNWMIQKVYSNDSTFFRVDAGPKERLSFKNNTDRKIINVDLEYLNKNKTLEVKRIEINLIKNSEEGKENEENEKKNVANTITNAIAKPEKKKRKEEVEVDYGKDQIGYQQIVIFDYESSMK